MAKTRARTKSGEFIGDDPSTPENEAFVEDKSAKKVAKKPSKKDLPPKGSSARKALILQGVIKE
mgnify:CR=1 FL=1|jgi:hypothetical protein|tara:strand:- start:2696 stop:2887 length:192 start_codon:yes stop_codon:yes gene_type:complete